MKYIIILIVFLLLQGCSSQGVRSKVFIKKFEKNTCEDLLKNSDKMITKKEAAYCYGRLIQKYYTNHYAEVNSPFQDIKSGSVYLPYILLSTNSGVLLPNTPVIFGAEKLLTYEEFEMAEKRMKKIIKEGR